jgi:ribosomal protein RSM22 (predicted rRNA methylase)
MFPDTYLNCLESYLSTKSTKKLSRSFKKLSAGYREFDNETLGSSKEDVDAYLIGRLPLTWSVLDHIFQISAHFFKDTVKIIDYGCGPASALLALHSSWQDKSISYVGIEEKQPMLDAAQYISQNLGFEAQFIKHDALITQKEVFDLAICSYLLNELADQEAFLGHLFKHHQTILVVEPGTPNGYQNILKFRKKAIESGYHIVMPCPHIKPCPLKGPDWCHFYVRSQRSRMLKRVKEASLGYEDEKYMFMLVSKNLESAINGVILEKPQIFPFEVELKVCSITGSCDVLTIPKKDKDGFKKAKKLLWGDFL